MAELCERDIELHARYREMHRGSSSESPRTQNTDGEPLSPRRVVFELASAQEAFDALQCLALDETDEDLLREAERDASGCFARVRFP